jgi:hypothetical protein
MSTLHASDRHPKGKFDSAGRWYPSNSEVRDCCERIRSPSRRWPYSLMLHCRTAKHVKLCSTSLSEPSGLRSAGDIEKGGS